MVRKTVAINDELVKTLEINHIIEKYQSFSEMVSSGLQLLIEKQKKEQYKKAMLQASGDTLYLEDMKEIEEAFAYVDGENNEPV